MITADSSVEEIEQAMRDLDDTTYAQYKREKQALHDLWERKIQARQFAEAGRAPSSLSQGIGFPGGQLGK